MHTTSANTAASKLLSTVIEGGYCIGCGNCASLPGSPFQMRLDEYGRFQATLTSEATADLPVLSLCPFSGQSDNETVIARDLFAQGATFDSRIGYHAALWAGYVAQGSYRDKGSSGGMGSWLLTELMRRNLVDAAIHVQQQEKGSNGDLLFRFRISRSVDEIHAGAKSRYYPVEMSKVLQELRATPGRYAVVAVPCFAKSVRLLMRQDSILRERIHFAIGLVCGHLKSSRFSDMFAWQCGIEPGSLERIDFRSKLSTGNANKYGIEVVGKNKAGERVQDVRRNEEFFGHLWGHGFLKYNACDFCDDVFAETADITVGDAWLPKYLGDPQGTNIVVARHPTLRMIVEEGIHSGALHMDPLSVEDAVRSQEAGLRHRRDGLAYRLYLQDQKKCWRPTKRVEATNQLPRRQRRIFELRLQMAKLSHEAFQKAIDAGQFELFRSEMSRLLDKYSALYKPSLKARLLHLLSRARKLVRRSVLGRSERNENSRHS